jgi:hypothetical protein
MSAIICLDLFESSVEDFASTNALITVTGSYVSKVLSVTFSGKLPNIFKAITVKRISSSV